MFRKLSSLKRFASDSCYQLQHLQKGWVLQATTHSTVRSSSSHDYPYAHLRGPTDSLRLLGLIVAVGGLHLLDKRHVALLCLLSCDALINQLLPGVLLRLALSFLENMVSKSRLLQPLLCHRPYRFAFVSRTAKNVPSDQTCRERGP